MTDIEHFLLFPPGKDKDNFLRADGIWDFISEGSGSNLAQFRPETLEYQKKYQTVTDAKSYNVGYQQRKQKRTHREIRLLRNLLSKCAHAQALLDLPCGGGRLSPVFGEFTDKIIEMDLSLGQLLYGRETCKAGASQVWIRASGFEIPLQNGSVDGAVCIRLSHHLHALEEKEKLLSELMRVAKYFIIFSFADSNSLKYSLRRWRHMFTAESLSKNSISVSEVREIVHKHGGRVLACPAIGPFQAHRYALIVK